MQINFDRQSLKSVATVISIALCAFQIYFTGGFGVTDTHILRGTHLSAISILVFLLIPPFKVKQGEKENPLFLLLDFVLVALSVAINVYVFQQAEVIAERLKYIDELTRQDIFYGTCLIIITLEITRRTSGLALVIISSAFLAYGLWGQYMPGGLAHNGISYDRLIEQLFLLSDGIYGVPLGAAAGMIFAFIMFGAFLECSNMSSVFMSLSCLLTRKAKGGPAKVAIFASALFGSINGSAASNVYGTGTFTIPLMKKVGYEPRFAGAVEAVASTGGKELFHYWNIAFFIMFLNGVFQAVGQQSVPSGVAAMLYGTTPLVMVMGAWLILGEDRPTLIQWAGIAGATAGMAVLSFGGEAAPDAGELSLSGAFSLMAGVISFVLGSLYSRHFIRHSRPSLFGGVSVIMLFGGMQSLAAGWIMGESVNWANVTAQAWYAMIFLTLFTSIFGYVCYYWLLANTGTIVAVSFAYIDPVIAVALGAIGAGEPLTPRIVLACALIVASVLCVFSRSSGISSGG